MTIPQKPRLRLLYVIVVYGIAIGISWAIFFAGPGAPSAPRIAMFALVVNLPGSIVALPLADWFLEQIAWPPTSTRGLCVVQLACGLANVALAAVVVRLIRSRRMSELRE